MGRGNGEQPPHKFVHDQAFCQLSFFMFIGVIMTLSSLSAGMDSGGSFSFPYFICGFILSPVLLVNLISRWYVVKTVNRKGVTRNNIIDTLNNETCGKLIWPWTCRLGMILCIPGMILTGVGGVSCHVTKENETIVEVKNTCYYDIEGEQSGLYKGLAIGLIVLHIFSFIFLLFSNCPVHSVLEQIKEDPRGNTVTPAASTAPAAATQSQEDSSNTSSNSRASARTGNEDYLKAKVRRLETRLAELEERETQRGHLNFIPPPPSYRQLMAEEHTKGANPV